jgi:hypothetical protein
MARYQVKTTARKKHRRTPAARADGAVVVDFAMVKQQRAQCVAAARDGLQDEKLASQLEAIAEQAKSGALKNPNDWKRTAIARSLEAIWLAVAEGDSRLLTQLERLALNELPRLHSRRGKRIGHVEHWTMAVLPTRAGFDRGSVLRFLRDTVAHNCTIGHAAGQYDADKIAWMLFEMVKRVFLQLDATDKDAILVRIKDRVKKRIDRTGKLDDEELIIDTLEAFQVPRATAQNWFKGAPPPSSELIAIVERAFKEVYGDP